jgi:SecA DEAD-like domain
MRAWWRSLITTSDPATASLKEVHQLRDDYDRLDNEQLTLAGRLAKTLPEVVAITAVVAARVLGLTMFDEQLLGALAMAQGSVVEMQTGEGKTLAAVPAIVWHARAKQGVHLPIDAMFGELQRTMASEIPARLATPEAIEATPMERGTTWTYLTTDEPFGSMSARIMRGLVRTLIGARPSAATVRPKGGVRTT